MRPFWEERMTEREIEEILQTEQDGAKVELAIDEYLRSRGIDPGSRSHK